MELLILLIRDMVVERWNRRFGFETIHPTQKFTSITLLQMPCMITWAWSFLTSEVVEAARGARHHILTHTLTQRSVHPTAPVLLTKNDTLICCEEDKQSAAFHTNVSLRAKYIYEDSKSLATL